MTHDILKSPDNVSFKGEDNDENILYIYRRAEITNVTWIIIGFLMLLSPIFFNSFIITINKYIPGALSTSLIVIINIFWYLFSIAFIFDRYVSWFFNVYIITNKRIVDMDYSGLLRIHISEAPLRNIEDITYSVTGTIQTLFNFGTIRIQTAAENVEFEFEEIANPGNVQDILSDLVADIRGNHGAK